MPALRDVMTSALVTLTPEMSLVEAASRMHEHRVSGAPVVDEGRVVGVVSNSDLQRTVAASREVAAFTPEELRQLQVAEMRALAAVAHHAAHVESDGAIGTPWVTPRPTPATALRRSVGEVMSRKLLTLPPDADVLQAAAIMQREGVHRVLVMEGEKLVGLVSAMDIVGAVGTAAGLEPELAP